jgi:hypothetical protein
MAVSTTALSTGRSTSNTPAEHVADHNTGHSAVNELTSVFNGWTTATPTKNASTFGVATSTSDNQSAMQAALASLVANSVLELPEGILTFRSASAGVVMLLSGLAGVTIRGRGRGTILRFDGVTATDGLRIDGCAQFTLENVTVQVTNASNITNAVQYTCPVGGGSHDGIFRSVKIHNPSKTYRQIDDAVTTTGSAVVTSAMAAFAAGDVGGGIGICQPVAGVFTSTISSVATRSNTLNGAINNSVTSIPLNGAIPSAPAGAYVVICGTELMYVTAGGTTSTLTVTRGYNGTTAASHSSGDPVTTYQATLAANCPDTTSNPYSAHIQTPSSSIMVNGMAVGGDQAASTLDIPNTGFFSVAIEGALGAAWKLGGGVAGNILNTYMSGCEAALSTLGVWINGATMSWVSSEVGSNGIDFKMTIPASQPVLVKNCRSELSGMFWEYIGGGTSGAPPIALENFAAMSFANTDGVPIRHQVSAPLSMRDGVLVRPTAGLTLLISANSGSASNPLYYTASNIAFNGGNTSPHPAAGTTIVRSITPGPRLSTSGLTSNRASYPAVFDTGLANGQATNGRSGTATLTGGTVVISNTSITAATLVKTWVQTLGTVTAPKVLYPSARSAGTSITITSADATDTSTFYYEFVEPF